MQGYVCVCGCVGKLLLYLSAGKVIGFVSPPAVCVFERILGGVCENKTINADCVGPTVFASACLSLALYVFVYVFDESFPQNVYTSNAMGEHSGCEAANFCIACHTL